MRVNRRFYSIDTTTGLETFLAQSTIGTNGDLGGFTYSIVDDTFYWSPRFTLRSVNPLTGIDTFIANISGVDQLSGQSDCFNFGSALRRGPESPTR